MMPKMMITSTITVASTGRRILNSDKVMLLVCSVFYHSVNRHRHSGSQLHNAGRQQRISDTQRADYFHSRGGTGACDDFDFTLETVFIHVRDIPSHLFHAGDAGDDDRVLDPIEGDAYAG